MSQQKGKASGAGKGKKSGKAAEGKREDVLQAVVIADSFQDRFAPFSVEKPRCLLPLANTPLIEYTLEFLAMNGVQEVYIYCGSHSEQIENYINTSRWSPLSIRTPFTSLQFIRVSDARSVGDFLRDLDGRGIMDGDFILVHGDVVSNISLDAALKSHKARKEVSATNIMTVVLRSGGAEEHRTKPNAVNPVFVMDSKTKRCLHYDETNPLQSDHYMSLDPAVVDELSTDFEIRGDLIDAGIDICTPEVLALWSESFDYELPRRNFLHGVLKDWELNGKAIYAEVLEDGYAARANNLQMYESISRDVLGRWTFPFVPDCNVIPGQTYKMTAGAVSIEDGTVLAPDSSLARSILGQGTSVGAGSRVTDSIIGRRCRIGKNVRIENSFIWDDAIIEDGAVVTRSILADSSIIGKGASVDAGCLISYGVTISENTKIPEATVLAVTTYNGSPVNPDTSLVGASGKGARYVDPEAEDADDEDPSILQRSLIYNLAHLNLSTSSVSTLSSEIEESDDEGFTPFADRARTDSFVSDDSAGKSGFHHDAVHGLLDALRADSGDFDSAKLEFMGLRLANDASDVSMRKAVAVAFGRRAAELLEPEHGGLEPAKAADKAFASKSGAAKFVMEVGVAGDEGDNEKEQVEFILALQRALLGARNLEQTRAGVLLAATLQKLYSLDVLEEEGIMAWWEDARAEEGEGMGTLKEKCKALIEWFEDAEEDSDEDDE
ncbi:putative translation initiation factor eIF-2B subunit epsilon [Colletotrichum gloeosporioides]|uniref:Translation initiation factor eIF2B subunit epsilon n=1 Tax=Colletotrichum gloeosporioides TaxID=474922 RepID=A0A8H4CL74_COLGL|nr:putative translation initiation factor eIF-2B subunit epsilon [Colletotrichum gloeosporioides]KAF3806010.1 putative translation initiation factor eIF-2B subunit epsilon [Colletotrichum gloeosporioides]